MRRIAAALFLLMVPASALAQVAAPSLCAPSPRVNTSLYPGAALIPPSNDLTRFNGKALSSEGQHLMIELRLRDTRCVPIQGAIIELWQANPYGKFRLATREDRVNPNPVFSGAGRAYTDNNGTAWFNTVFPGAQKNEAPRLYLRIKEKNSPFFDTVVFFENDVRNASDAAYKKLKPEDRRRVELKMNQLSVDPNAGFAGALEIILPNKVRYRTY